MAVTWLFNKLALKKPPTCRPKTLSCLMANIPASCPLVGLICNPLCPDNNCGLHSLPDNSPSKANSSPHKALNHHKVAQPLKAALRSPHR